MELPFFTIFIGTVLFIGLIIGFIKGVKRGFYSLICNLISIVLAFGLTRLTILVLSKRGLAPIGEKILGAVKIHELTNVAELELTSKFIGTVCLALILFYVFYIILLIVSEPLKRKLFNKVTRVNYSKYNVLFEKKWYMKILAAIISIISCAATCYVLTFAVVAVNDAVIKGFEESNKISTPYVFKVIKDDYAYPIVQKGMAETVFNTLTAVHDKDAKPVTTNEITQGIRAVSALTDVVEGENIEENLDVITQIIDNTEVIPEVTARLIVEEANKVEPNEVKKNEKGGPARFARLQNELLIFAKSTNNSNVNENVKTAVTLGKLIIEKDLLDSNDYEDVIDALKDKDFVEDLFVGLFNNKNTQSVMGSLIDLCVGAVFDDMNIDVKETYIFSLDYSKLSLGEVKKEANIISTIADDYEIIEKLSRGETISSEETEKIKEDLEVIEECEIITNTVYDTVRGFVRNSEIVSEE